MSFPSSSTRSSATSTTAAYTRSISVQDLVKRKIEDLRGMRTQLNRILEDQNQNHIQIHRICELYVQAYDVVNMHSTVFSPIRRVPTEIVHYIFKPAVQSDSDQYPFPSTLVSITHVNREWRHLALSTPSLWSKLHITLPRYPFPQRVTGRATGLP